ncbi:MAG: hypothetical protein CMJ35_00765 [Phycisphaerae bacterium]|nr:hypothetical protein [Phycisphaerae bacterium]
MSIFKQSQAKRRKTSATNPIGCLSLFGLIWMLTVLGIDGFLLHSGYKILDARERYLSVPGVVVQSRVDARTDSDGTTYTPLVEYEFEVDGQSYRSDQHSMFVFGTSMRKDAQRVIDRYPVGKDIEVHYDPDDPSEAVLDLSDRAIPYVLLLFLTPFHCVGLGLLGGGVVSLRKWLRYRKDQAVSAYIARSTPRRMVLEDAHWAGYMVFFFVTGLSSFVAIFVVAFGFGFSLQRDAALMVVGSCIGAGILVPTIMRLVRGGKRRRLLIDWNSASFTRAPESLHISIGSIKTIRLKTAGTSTRVNERPWYKHTIVGVADTGQEHTLLIAKGYRELGPIIRDWFAQRFEAAAEELDLPEEESPSMEIVSEVEINRTKT